MSKGPTPSKADYDVMTDLIATTSKASSSEWKNIYPRHNLSTVSRVLKVFRDAVAGKRLTEDNLKEAIEAANAQESINKDVVAVHNHDREQYKKRIEELKEQARNADIRASAAELNMNDLRVKLEQCQNTSENVSELETHTVEAYEKRIANLKLEVSNRDHAIKRLTDERETVKADLSASRQISTERREKLDKANNMIHELENLLEHAETGRKNLARTNEAYRLQHDSLVSGHKEMESEKDQYKARLVDSEKQRSELTKELEIMREDRDGLANTLRQALVESKELNKKIGQGKIDAGHEVFALKQRIEDLTAQYQAMTLRYNNAQNALERSQDAVLSLAEIIGGMHGKKN